MFWYIIAALVIGFGIYAYFNSRKPGLITHPEIKDGGHTHDKNSHEHNHKSGQGCCK